MTSSSSTATYTCRVWYCQNTQLPDTPNSGETHPASSGRRPHPAPRYRRTKLFTPRSWPYRVVPVVVRREQYRRGLAGHQISGPTRWASSRQASTTHVPPRGEISVLSPYSRSVSYCQHLAASASPFEGRRHSTPSVERPGVPLPRRRPTSLAATLSPDRCGATARLSEAANTVADRGASATLNRPSPCAPLMARATSCHGVQNRSQPVLAAPYLAGRHNRPSWRECATCDCCSTNRRQATSVALAHPWFLLASAL